MKTLHIAGIALAVLSVVLEIASSVIDGIESDMELDKRDQALRQEMDARFDALDAAIMQNGNRAR